jgi:hypothetical protein
MSVKCYDKLISLVGDHQGREGIRKGDDTGSEERPVIKLR